MILPFKIKISFSFSELHIYASAFQINQENPSKFKAHFILDSWDLFEMLLKPTAFKVSL